MKINVKGAIISNEDKWIYDWFGMDATCPNDVSKALNTATTLNEEAEVDINSGGGSVFAGSEIYTTLKSYPGNVTTNIVGIAASAASVIAMAGNKVRMSPTGQIMIHNASGQFNGDYRDMQLGADILKSVNDSISNAYMIKTGKTKADLLDMMDNETWLTAQKALENKFIDEIMFSDGIKLSASTGGYTLPLEVINKVRNELKKPQEPQNDEEIELLKSKLNLELL